MSATNFSAVVPSYLVEQIDRRASAFGRTRNAEWRHLLSLGLEFADEGVVGPEMPPKATEVPWRQVTIRIPEDTMFEVRGMSEDSGRRVGPEVLYLILMAMEETARRDMAIIKQMIERQGSTTH
jgi:hypothetical protein